MTGASEPTAELIVAEIARRIGRVGDDPRPHVTISLGALRNQSHARPAEFDRLRERLALVLTPAGEPLGIEFVPGEDDLADYRLDGAAYLVTRAGFDAWELYLRLSPFGRQRILWEPGMPVHVLRNPRPGQPELVVIPNATR